MGLFQDLRQRAEVASDGNVRPTRARDPATGGHIGRPPHVTRDAEKPRTVGDEVRARAVLSYPVADPRVAARVALARVMTGATLAAHGACTRPADGLRSTSRVDVLGCLGGTIW